MCIYCTPINIWHGKLNCKILMNPWQYKHGVSTNDNNNVCQFSHPSLDFTLSLSLSVCIQLATKGILKYCLRGLCGDTQRNTLYYLFDTQLLAAEIPYEHLNELEQQVHIALARLERDFLVSVQLYWSDCNSVYLGAYMASRCNYLNFKYLDLPGTSSSVGSLFFFFTNFSTFIG